MLEFRHIYSHKNYYHFNACVGERWHLHGPTGAGKTTFFNSIAGLRPFEKGDMIWHEKLLNFVPIKERPISYLMQDCQVFPHLCIKTHLKLMPDKPYAQFFFDKYLRHTQNQLGQNLSGGEKHILGLIRILSEKRSIILLDEAFVGMDENLKKDIMKDLYDHQQAFPCVILFTNHENDMDKFMTHRYCLRT